MKLSATLKNNRGGQKTTADDTRILIDLKHGNKLIGTIGLYNIIDDKVEGYRVTWDIAGKGYSRDNILLEFEKGKQQTSKRDIACHCGYPCIHGTDYCERHQIP